MYNNLDNIFVRSPYICIDRENILHFLVASWLLTASFSGVLWCSTLVLVSVVLLPVITLLISLISSFRPETICIVSYLVGDLRYQYCTGIRGQGHMSCGWQAIPHPVTVSALVLQLWAEVVSDSLGQSPPTCQSPHSPHSTTCHSTCQQPTPQATLNTTKTTTIMAPQLWMSPGPGVWQMMDAGPQCPPVLPSITRPGPGWVSLIMAERPGIIRNCLVTTGHITQDWVSSCCDRMLQWTTCVMMQTSQIWMWGGASYLLQQLLSSPGCECWLCCDVDGWWVIPGAITSLPPPVTNHGECHIQTLYSALQGYSTPVQHSTGRDAPLLAPNANTGQDHQWVRGPV